MKNIIISRGHTSFCEGHLTRYWRITIPNLKRNITHYIEMYDNGPKYSDTYHCYIDYGGCLPCHSLNTNNFKEAMHWLFGKMKNYIKQ